MKNAGKSYSVIAGLFLAALTGMLLLPACTTQSSDAYNYPVKPGTDAWKAFGSHTEMIDACQVPQDILKGMSTKGLVETVLNYPLLMDMSAYNFLQDGFDQVASWFNGLAELLNRKDAGVELLAKYKTMDSADIEDGWADVEKGNYMFKIRAIEMLLAQEPVLVNMTSAERRSLLEECIKKYEKTKQHPELFSRFSLEPIAWAMGRVLRQGNYTPFIKKITQDNGLKNFLDKGNFSTDPVLDEISLQAANFLAQK